MIGLVIEGRDGTADLQVGNRASSYR